MPYPAVDDQTALEEVLAFLGKPPVSGSLEDDRFGARLRQVIAASTPESDDDGGLDDARLPLKLSSDVRRQLDVIARRRAATHPFGEHPDGIGPTLGMDLSRS